MNKLLTVNKLCKGQILKDISFSVKCGEMVAIMGPSGSGKSTLLYNIAGMDKATSGEILLGNEDITKLTEDETAKLRLNRVGFVFQYMNMMNNLNIIDNILLPARMLNKKKHASVLIEKAHLLMDKLSISGIDNRGVNEVSGGQLQRVCIARSMINDPIILLADEPTGSLNKMAASQVMQEFIKLNKEGTTILMVTHDSTVASKCDRVLYLLDGKICDELVLNKFDSSLEQARKEKINKWLSKMGW